MDEGYASYVECLGLIAEAYCRWRGLTPGPWRYAPLAYWRLLRHLVTR